MTTNNTIYHELARLEAERDALAKQVDKWTQFSESLGWLDPEEIKAWIDSLKVQIADAEQARIRAEQARDNWRTASDEKLAQIAALREALKKALGVLLSPYCDADEDAIQAVENALAATEGGTK